MVHFWSRSPMATWSVMPPNRCHSMLSHTFALSLTERRLWVTISIQTHALVAFVTLLEVGRKNESCYITIREIMTLRTRTKIRKIYTFKKLHSKYSICLVDHIIPYIMVVGTAYQECLLITRWAVFTGYRWIVLHQNQMRIEQVWNRRWKQIQCKRTLLFIINA